MYDFGYGGGKIRI